VEKIAAGATALLPSPAEPAREKPAAAAREQKLQLELEEQPELALVPELAAELDLGRPQLSVRPEARSGLLSVAAIERPRSLYAKARPSRLPAALSLREAPAHRTR